MLRLLGKKSSIIFIVNDSFLAVLSFIIVLEYAVGSIKLIFVFQIGVLCDAKKFRRFGLQFNSVCFAYFLFSIRIWI